MSKTKKSSKKASRRAEEQAREALQRSFCVEIAFAHYQPRDGSGVTHHHAVLGAAEEIRRYVVAGESVTATRSAETLVSSRDPELDRLLAEEEEIKRRTHAKSR